MNDYIKREDAVEAVWRILNGMGISQKHNERLVEEVDAVVDEYFTDAVSGRDFRDCRNELCLQITDSGTWAPATDADGGTTMAEYIERGAFFQEMQKHRPVFSSGLDGTKERLAFLTWHSCINAIKTFPAADVRPVVRGKWKVSAHKTYYDVSCSVCGINSFFQVDEKDSVSYANYCPNCGAKMEES